jgi:hypothetical protein
MARSDQGDNLRKLVLQAGGSFVETKGGFDTGSRTFVCDAAYADRLAPRVGESDANILKRARPKVATDRRRAFSTMYADAVDTKDIANGMVEFTVSYLGLMYGAKTKRQQVQEITEAQSLSEVPTGGFLNTVTFLRPLPRVRVVRIADKRPNRADVGSKKIPPGFSNDLEIATYWVLIRPTVQVVFKGWVLQSRSVDEAGASKTGMVYEVTDEYAYIVHELPQS